MEIAGVMGNDAELIDQIRGVAEESRLMGALIRKLVKVAPAWAITWIIVFVGMLSSVASDVGYLILIPLAAAAFLSVG